MYGNGYQAPRQNTAAVCGITFPLPVKQLGPGEVVSHTTNDPEEPEKWLTLLYHAENATQKS